MERCPRRLDDSDDVLIVEQARLFEFADRLEHRPHLLVVLGIADDPQAQPLDREVRRVLFDYREGRLRRLAEAVQVKPGQLLD